MTEPASTTTAETPAKKKHSLLLPIAAVIITIGVGGFFASRAGLDKALVKQQVDNFIVQLKEKGRASGRDMDLTYAELDVAGSFANKHVVMRSPVLTVKPMEREHLKAGEKKTIDALRITTPAVEIYPGLSSMTIKAAQPIDFVDEDAPEKMLLKVKSNTPHEVVSSKSKVGEVNYSKVEYRAPSQMEFTYLKEQQAQGAEEQTPTVVPVFETMTLVMAQGGVLSANMAEDGSELGEASVNFRELVITPHAAPEGAVKLAEVTGKWSNMLNDKKLNVVTAMLKAGPVTSDNASFPHLPIALNLDASYEGAMPNNAQAVATIQSPESLMVLKNFELTTKDSSLKATANFTASAADSLPVGNATIAITNVPFVVAELRKYKLLSEASESLVMALLTKITATPAAQLKDAVIPIERARGGAFKIGSSTFEELFAVFLQQAMQQKSGEIAPVPAPADAAPAIAPSPDESSGLGAPLVPNLPPADKTKLAPIEIPDLSVRG